MYGILLAFHIIIAVLLIGFILIQQGKGAQAGAAFGSGASQTVFGSQGSSGFLSRATVFLAAIFFILSLVLAFVVNKAIRSEAAADMPIAPVTETQPVSTPRAPDVPSDIPPVD